MSIWKKFLRWWNNQDAIDYVGSWNGEILRVLGEQTDRANKLQFLLEQAPMMDINPNGYEMRSRLRASTIAFAYVNAKTMVSLIDVGKPAPPYIKIPGSPTKWILTPLIPEGKVIFSPNRMPGLDERYA